MEDERSNIFHRLKLCTFDVEILGSGSGNMASDIAQANALGRRFDNLEIRLSNLRPTAFAWTISDAIFPLPDPSNSTPMEEERSNIFHILKLCTFGVELLGTESGNMAWDIGPPNAVDRRFDDLK